MRFLRSCCVLPRTRERRRSPRLGSSRAALPFGTDAGFGLPEILVSVGIIFVTLLALAHTLTASLNDIGLARQRQGANALANRAVELVRALPYDTVRRGLRTSDLVGDASIVTCAGMYRLKTCSGEPVVHTAGLEPNPPLVPNRMTETVPASPTRYDVTAYLTSASAVASGPLRLTVTVSWDQKLRAAADGHVTVETIVYAPKGCVDQSTHPLTAPCQPFFYGTASAAKGAVSVTGTINGTTIGGSFETTSVRADMQAEQVQHIQGAASATRLSLTGGAAQAAGGESVASSADDDPATSAVPGYDTRMLAAGPEATVQDEVGGNALSVSRSSGSSGTTTSATAAGGPAPGSGTQVCAAPAPESDGEPCAYDSVRQDESAELRLDPVGSLGPANLASLGPAPAPATAQVDRDSNAGDGTVLVTAERSFGELMLGGLPTGVDTPAGWTGHWIRVTPYRADVTASTGHDTASPTASESAGTVEIWNGSGYTSVALGGAPTALGIAPLTLANVPAGTDHVDVSISGSVRTGGRSTKDPDGPGDGIMRSEASATVTSPVVADIAYALVVRDASGAEVLNAQLKIAVDLGALSAQADYREANVG